MAQEWGRDRVLWDLHAAHTILLASVLHLIRAPKDGWKSFLNNETISKLRQSLSFCTKWAIKTDASDTKTRAISWPSFTAPGCQAECSPTDEQINEMRCIYTTEFYTATKKNEITTFADGWWVIVLGEIGLAQKGKCFMFSHTQTLKYATRVWTRRNPWEGRTTAEEGSKGEEDKEPMFFSHDRMLT